jgi:hypothetical protein
MRESEPELPKPGELFTINRWGPIFLCLGETEKYTGNIPVLCLNSKNNWSNVQYLYNNNYNFRKLDQ